MTFAKISAGTGYLYLIRHTALGDAEPTGERDAAAYYSAQGNPPGRWTGRGAPLLGLAGRTVAEGQMRALFGLGAHPDMDAIVDAHIDERWRPWMTGERWDRLVGEAIRSATLGRQFPRYRQLDPFGDRVAARLDAIRGEAGREPTEAEAGRVRAREARRQRDAVAGYDLVFSPVKSAALLWAVDPRPRVQEGIAAAHAAAKDAALAVLEEHAAFTRTGADGVAQIATKGLIAAEFEHWDSRAGDPNLHTHVAVSSKVMGIDGVWRSLDGRPLHSAAVAISETYNTVFEAELTARLGVTFTARPGTPDGREPVREITGVPTAMVEHFSRRRAAIEARYAELELAYREEHSREPDAGSARRLARQANLETREGKRPPAPLADKRAAWREELTDRFGSDSIVRLMGVVPRIPVIDASANAPTTVDCGDLAERTVAAVSTRRSTWTVWNVRAEVERQLRNTVPALAPGRHGETADAIIEAVLARSVCVEPPPLHSEPHELRRPGGESVFIQHAAARYTCQAVLDAETQLVAAARTLTAAGLSGPAVAAALDGFEARAGTALDPGQRHLVTVFAADSRLLLAGIGAAGAGKTTAMRALAHVLRQGGRNLVPLATSAAAADVLGRELGVRAENLHKFLYEWTAGPFAAKLQSGASVPGGARMFRLGPGDVILVDEAGMAGTFALDSLTAHAAKRGAVVRLLGDDRQLPAVDAGGALRLVAAEADTPELTTLYRFHDPAEATATLKLRTGDPDAIDWYHDHDRIRGGSRRAMTQAAYDGWKADMLAGKVTLMAALAGTEVTALAARARADRVIAGQVEPEGTQLHDGNLAGRGDWIVTRRNDRRLATRGSRDWVKNGDAWTVERRDHDGALTVKNITHGGRITLPADYVAAHVQLLYATTSHRAQGSTVDTAHPLITENMNREALYVLASRARERTTLYVATHDRQIDSDDDAHVNTARHDPHRYEAREILLNILANQSATLSATEAIATARDDAASLAVLIPRYVHAVRQYAATRGSGPGACSAGILPWVPSPPEAPGDRLATHLTEAAALIGTRAEQLTDAVVRDPPGWARSLGNPPEDPERYPVWRHQIEIIAAYRDQQRITLDDPRHILGPFPDPDHSAFVAHVHATQAVQSARTVARTEQARASTVDTGSRSDVPRDNARSSRSLQTATRSRAPEMQPSRQARPTLSEPHQAPQTDHRDPSPRP